MFYNCIMEGKALPDYSGTDPYQVNLTFKAPILDAAFVIFIRNEQNRSPPGRTDERLRIADKEQSRNER